MLQFRTVAGSSVKDALVLLFIAYVVASIRAYRRLSHIPGPRLWAWSVLPLFRVHARGDIYDKFGELNNEYGPLVRVAPNTLLTSDSEVLRRMSAPRSPYTRSDWFIAMRLIPGQDNVLSTRDEKRHDELRRKMNAGYAGKENISLERDVDDCVLELISLIDSKYISTTERIIPMDLAQKIQFFTSDIMSKLSFDAKFHDLRDDNDNFGYIHEVETMFPNIFCTCTIPRVIEFLTDIGLLKLFAPSGKSKLGLGKVLAITHEQVSKRFCRDGKVHDDSKDMLGSFLRHGLSQHEAEQESVMQLAAGSDTSATGMRATLLGIITNPAVHVRLLDEIDAAVAAEQIPSELGSIVSDAQAKLLPYLQACIKEGLRWYPPIAGMLAKKTPPEGDTILGHFVPAGVSVGYSAKGLHHSPALYGPDPTSYRPERWLHTSEGGDEPSTQRLYTMERTNELIFGSGKYQCLGKNVAMIELNKVVLELLRRFEFRIVDPLKVWETSCYGIHLQRKLWVTVRRRGVDSDPQSH